MTWICRGDRSASRVQISETSRFDCSEKCDPLSELFNAKEDFQFSKGVLSQTSLPKLFAKGHICYLGYNKILLINQPWCISALLSQHCSGRLTFCWLTVNKCIKGHILLDCQPQQPKRWKFSTLSVWLSIIKLKRFNPACENNRFAFLFNSWCCGKTADKLKRKSRIF